MNIYHTAEDRTPYTYLIGWTQHNKWYYGVRFAKNCHPSDLWVSYFTSSTLVKAFVKEFGNPDKIQIRKTFGSVNSARQWEQQFLKKSKAVLSEKSLNKFDGIAICPEAALKGATTKGKNTTKWSEERKNTLSKRATELNFQERINSDYARAKSIHSRKILYDAMSIEEKRERTKQMNSSEARHKANQTRISNFEALSKEERAILAEKRSLTSKEAYTKSSYNCALDFERNAKIKASKLVNNPNFTNKVECPHCGKCGQYSAMKRWHFENCKLLSYNCDTMALEK